MNPRFRNPPGVAPVGCALALSVAVAAACGDVTTPTVSRSSEFSSAAPFVHSGPDAVAQEGGLLIVRGDRILLTTLTGGEPTVVADHARLPSWSADGSMIAFTWDGSSSDHAPGRWTLCVAKADGSETRCVSTDDGSSIHFPASWSPDGRSLAFSLASPVDALFDGDSGLYVLDVATMDYRMVTNTPVRSPSWSPDGDRIAVVYGNDWNWENDYSGSLGTIRPDGSEFQTVSSGDGRYLFRQVMWSPSGGQLAFILSDQSRCPMGCVSALGVASFDADSSDGAIGPLQVLGPEPAFGGLSWSPDEARVAFVRWTCQASCIPNVMSVDVAEGTETLLVPDASQPAWSRR